MGQARAMVRTVDQVASNEFSSAVGFSTRIPGARDESWQEGSGPR
jgi:hypothetical protein